MSDHDRVDQELPCNDNNDSRSIVKASECKRRSPTPGPFGRTNPDPGDDFRATFTPAVKQQIVKLLRIAYDTEVEKYDESLGYNPTTFGFCVYHLAKFRLQKHLSEFSGIEFSTVDQIGALFRMHGGQYNVGVYKVGHSAQTNIWEAFPPTENGANPGKNEGQPFLGGFELSMLDDVTKNHYVIVAHLGNPKDGLVAVYLCIPMESEHGKIKRWGYAEQIFSADDVLGALPLEPTGLVPAEEPEVPVNPTPVEEPEGDVVVTALDVD